MTVEMYNLISEGVYNDTVDVYEDIYNMTLSVRSVTVEDEAQYPEIRLDGKIHLVLCLFKFFTRTSEGAILEINRRQKIVLTFPFFVFQTLDYYLREVCEVFNYVLSHIPRYRILVKLH